MDHITETINTYNSYADEYKKRYQDFDVNTMEPHLRKFTKQICPAGKILDIGGGAGFDAKYLSEKGYDVTSIDLADDLIEIGKEVAPKAQFINMDMREMTFDVNFFDGVWASASILHLTKKEAADVIKNINKMLKPKGVFYLALKEGKGEDYVINMGENNLANAKRYFAYYSMSEVKDLLSTSGFKILCAETSTNRENVWINVFAKNTKID